MKWAWAIGVGAFVLALWWWPSPPPPEGPKAPLEGDAQTAPRPQAPRTPRPKVIPIQKAPSPVPQASRSSKKRPSSRFVPRESRPEERIRIGRFTYVPDPEVTILHPRDPIPEGATIVDRKGGWVLIERANEGEFPLSLGNYENQNRGIMTGTIIVKADGPEVVDGLEDRFNLSHMGSAEHLGIYFFQMEAPPALLENFPENLDRFIQKIRMDPDVNEANFEVLESFVTAQ